MTTETFAAWLQTLFEQVQLQKMFPVYIRRSALTELKSTHVFHSQIFSTAMTPKMRTFVRAKLHCLQHVENTISSFQQLTQTRRDQNTDSIYREHLQRAFTDSIYRQHLQTAFTDSIYRQHLQTAFTDSIYIVSRQLMPASYPPYSWSCL